MDADFLAPPDGDGWNLIAGDEYRRVWLRELEPGVWQQCITLNTDPLFEANQALRNDNTGRWGDGQIVASIPLALYYRDIVPAKQNGDEAWIRKYLNDRDNRKLRTREGTI